MKLYWLVFVFGLTGGAWLVAVTGRFTSYPDLVVFVVVGVLTASTLMLQRIYFRRRKKLRSKT